MTSSMEIARNVVRYMSIPANTGVV